MPLIRLSIDGETHTIREWAIISKEKYQLQGKLSSISGAIYARVSDGSTPRDAVFFLDGEDGQIDLEKSKANRRTQRPEEGDIISRLRRLYTKEELAAYFNWKFIGDKEC